MPARSTAVMCTRSEEHTSELQSLAYLVCRLLLEKKKRWSNTSGTRVDAWRSDRQSLPSSSALFRLFFFHDTATTEIYTLPLHDALPIYGSAASRRVVRLEAPAVSGASASPAPIRSEEHTSELQSLADLVCRLLLEK